MTPNEFEAMQLNREMTAEEFEFYEDFLYLAEVATKEEIAHVDGEFVITHSGEVKLNPNFELKKYIDSRNNQKKEKHLKEQRMKRFSLIKG